MKSLIVALQFLTRIPLFITISVDPKLSGRSLLWYPLVGVLIGAVLYATTRLMVNQPQLLTAIMVLIIWVLITGGLHLDGLADSADAWAGGYGNKKKTLEIMKDPHVGSLAIVVLVLVLLLKFVALSELVKTDKIMYLILAPMLARSAVVYLFLTTPYVRPQGLGANMAKYLPHTMAIMVLLLFIVPAVLLHPLAVLAAGVVLTGLRYLMLKRLAGMTGDTLGASIEITEAVVLVSLLLM